MLGVEKCPAVLKQRARRCLKRSKGTGDVRDPEGQTRALLWALRKGKRP